MTPALQAKAAERAAEVKKFSQQARALRALVANNPEWDHSPLIADRVTYEVARNLPMPMPSSSTRPARSRCTASISIPSAGASCSTITAPTSAQASARRRASSWRGPNQQVICLVGDGSFIFGPTALWNMARLELPVIVVVYNNHAYSGPHSRVVANVPSGPYGADRAVRPRLPRQS